MAAIVICISHSTVSAGKRIPVTPCRGSDQNSPDKGESDDWSRRRAKFATNLLRKRSTYTQYLEDGLKPGGPLELGLLRVAVSRSLEVACTELPVGRVFEVKRVDRVKCTSEQKKRVKKYASAVLNKRKKRCASLQALETKRVDGYFSTHVGQQREIAIGPVARREYHLQARAGVVFPPPDSGRLVDMRVRARDVAQQRMDRSHVSSTHWTLGYEEVAAVERELARELRVCVDCGADIRQRPPRSLYCARCV